QLNKLIDVVTVTDFTKKEHVDRELVLVKVGCVLKEKAKLEGLLHKYVAKLIQHKTNTAIIEAVGDQEQIKQLLEGLKSFEIKELVRSGRLALAQ
ncbi:MAG: acetolactate synthase small subunit, partial [Candidatus Omnitrophica bacterium]|nr:acetolactate synthase small subunit [Candidatus Omnitrophota bacterium]